MSHQKKAIGETAAMMTMQAIIRATGISSCIVAPLNLEEGVRGSELPGARIGDLELGALALLATLKELLLVDGALFDAHGALGREGEGRNILHGFYSRLPSRRCVTITE